MKEKIIDLLSKKIDKTLTVDLINSYESIKNEYVIGNYDNTLSKSGKFVENVFRVLNFIKNNSILKEIKQNQINDLTKDLLNADGSIFPESIRILIPIIANSLIYQPRSKLGAVHVKPISPDYIDAKLCVGAADWIIAELLRLYHERNTDEVIKLINNVVKEYLPVIQKIGEEKFVTIKTTCKIEILLHLYDSENGLTRKEIGEAIKNHSAPRITEAIKSMVKDKDIFFTKEKKYVISERSKKEIAKIFIESK